VHAGPHEAAASPTVPFVHNALAIR